ncbi:DUF2345 domain-containing protein [Variovorax sp. UC122_21]|uniref:DUF2345 domain-containing protein n=1 Tax=Variovorax sp. UC122_21 TaxID=3374554 RepID=UPI0037582C25
MLAEAARLHRAQDAGIDQHEVQQALAKQNAAIVDTGAPFPELEAPHLVLASPAGIAASTSGAMHLHAKAHAAFTSRGHLSFSSAKRWLASAAEGIRAFTQRHGIRFIAAEGPIDLEAHADELVLLAHKDVRIRSIDGELHISARKKVVIVGGGSYTEWSAQGDRAWHRRYLAGTCGAACAGGADAEAPRAPDLFACAMATVARPGRGLSGVALKAKRRARAVIISPPFLPERAAGQSESAWLDVAMAPPASRLPGTQAPEGSFPLSLQLAWHNGLHIQAPQSAGAYLPVRAVADGRVVFVHAPTTPNSDLHHPLNYNPFGASPPTAAWTSDGFMAIEHRTEIGAAQATATEVVYYSVYMHLESLSRSRRTNAPWAPGDAIYRKEVIGMPGQIYGHAGQLHFEICCDETNLRHLTGRAPRWADPDIAFVPATDGRTDSVFGNAYIYLPAGTPTSTHRPSMHVRSALPAGGGASAATDHFPPDTLRVPLWLRIAHEEGNAMLATFDRHGQPIGAPRLDSRHDYIRHTASPTPRGRFEYDLCAAAKDRHDALPSADQARSSASGWYELLRFGRNLGSDPLPADAVHWRKIVTSEGELWVDLNAAGTLKFSDADFPTIAGWNFFDDDGTPSDLRCDSRNLKASIRDPDPSNKRRMEREELVKRLGETQVRARLRRAICRFPTEWDQTEIEASYGWLETADLKPADDDATGARKSGPIRETRQGRELPRLASGTQTCRLALSSQRVHRAHARLRVAQRYGVRAVLSPDAAASPRNHFQASNHTLADGDRAREQLDPAVQQGGEKVWNQRGQAEASSLLLPRHSRNRKSRPRERNRR